MFIKPKPMTPPPGSDVSYEVRFPKGRKPFPTLVAANAFRDEQRAAQDGWAEVSQVVRIVIDRRS